MCGTTYLVVRHTPFRLTPRTVSQSSSVSSQLRPKENTPAFAARMSTLPNSSITAAAMRSQSPASATLARIAMQRLPEASISAFVCSRSSVVDRPRTRSDGSSPAMSAIAMSAPSAASARAIARPKPRAPPVINATLPARSDMPGLLLGWSNVRRSGSRWRAGGSTWSSAADRPRHDVIRDNCDDGAKAWPVGDVALNAFRADVASADRPDLLDRGVVVGCPDGGGAPHDDCWVGLLKCLDGEGGPRIADQVAHPCARFAGPDYDGGCVPAEPHRHEMR